MAPKGEYGVELAVVPGAFEELQHEDAHAVADGAQGGAEGGGGFALAGAGVDEDEAFARVGHAGELEGNRKQGTEYRVQGTANRESERITEENVRRVGRRPPPN